MPLRSGNLGITFWISVTDVLYLVVMRGGLDMFMKSNSLL